MTRVRVTSVVVLALAALAAPGARAQSPKPASQPRVCDPVRYQTLRDIVDESRTYEQEMEFERLQRACADAAVENLRHARAPSPQSAQSATKAAPTASGPQVLGRPMGTLGPEAAALRAAEVPPAPAQAAAAPARRGRPAWDEAPLRHGFWFSVGAGWGTLGCDGCGSRQSAPSGSISFGGTLSQHVQYGLSTNGWVKSEAGATISTGALTGLVKVYPVSRAGLYLLGGAGVSAFNASASTGGFGFTATTTGAGAVAGLGYDVRVARKLSLTPFANGVGMRFEGANYDIAQLGLAVTFH